MIGATPMVPRGEDERCYVVRGKDGDRCYSSDRPDGRFTRGEALQVAGILELHDEAGVGLRKRPFRLYRLIPKRKPKAPREVFVAVGADGVLEPFQPRTLRKEADDLARRIGCARVVRYVLADGE